MKSCTARLRRVMLAALVGGGAVGCGGETAPPPPDDGNIPVRSGSVTIMGTLDKPATPGPYPVMVFVPGSGRTTREADQPAVDLAVPQGVAVFRYDKRGLGQSTGLFEEVTVANSDRVLNDRAADVAAIVEYLATRPDIRADRIFLWGTSQGAWVAPLVAGKTSRLAFIIALSGGGSSVGTSDHYDELTDDPSVTVAQATAQLAAFPGPFGYDPEPTLRGLTLPVLWIFGGLDRSNPSYFDSTTVDRVRGDFGRDFTIALFPRMNHDLIDVDTGVFPADLFPTVFAWVIQQFGAL
ncbi:MAG: alpha/beta hydrolase family protein [Gemmatimonadales bacterium]